METKTTPSAKSGIQLPATLQSAKEKFEVICRSATGLQIANNFGGAFEAAIIIKNLREILTPEIMEAVFMPLMNQRTGFLTDHTGKPRGNRPPLAPYGADIVRDAIIDAVTIGLLPTGNQFNIIAERMYPTKEGYTALLRRLGVKYFIDVSYDKSQTKGFAEIPCKITYEYNGEKSGLNIVATVKKDDYSSPDQLRGKAERRAKKALYEFLTGCDFGDADEDSSTPIDTAYEEVKTNANTGATIDIKPQAQAAPQSTPQTTAQTASTQTNESPKTPGF